MAKKGPVPANSEPEGGGWSQKKAIVVPAVIGAAAVLIVGLIGPLQALVAAWAGHDEDTRDQVSLCMKQFEMTSNPETTLTEKPNKETGEIRSKAFQGCEWPATAYTDKFGHYEITAVTYEIEAPASDPYLSVADRIQASCDTVELGYVTSSPESIRPVRATKGTQIFADDGHPWHGDKFFPYGPADEIVAVHGIHLLLDAAHCAKP
jgi:hypothetical protein